MLEVYQGLKRCRF